jgi:hypothetical protein
MDLQPGVTGIQDAREGPFSRQPVPDLRCFRSNCYEAARLAGATVLTVEDPSDFGLLRSYLTAHFKFSDRVVMATLNRYYPILAFAEASAERQVVLEYVDCPKLAEAFKALGPYTVATREELRQPLTRERCKDLTPTEQACVRYFRPARVGDVIFNYWD